MDWKHKGLAMNNTTKPTRELKFRAWYDNCHMTNDVQISGCGEIPPVVVGDMHSDCPIMQFTGLQDKNGTDIYEGDIVTDDIDTGVVKLGLWDNEPNYGYETIYGWHVYCINPSPLNSAYKVIGNIHEHPELLESVESE